MSNFSWSLFIVVIVFFIFVGIRFRKTKRLSNFVYQPDEKLLFEENPVQIEQMTNAGAPGKRTRGIMWPIIKITNKHIIIGQQKESRTNGIIYTVLSFSQDTGSMVSDWWKVGYIIMPITKSEIQGVVGKDGTYMIEIPIDVPVPNRGVVRQVICITTNNFASYEKALDMKIPLKQEN